MKKLGHLLEYLAFLLFYGFFRALPLPAASSTGKHLAQWLGPRLKPHRYVLRNLAIAFPKQDTAWHQHTAIAMWQNLGRIIGEYPHMRSPHMLQRLHIENPEKLAELQTQFSSLNFCGAHLGNWELYALIAEKLNVPATFIYRHTNNPYVDRFVRNHRTTELVNFVPKGKEAARSLLRAIKSGENLGMLMDQKMNQGRMIPLFGKDAPTPTTHAEMARRFNVPIVPVQCVRTENNHFSMRFEDPILPAEGETEEAIENEMLRQWHARLEDWIQQHPEQWFWVHRRWPKEEYK